MKMKPQDEKAVIDYLKAECEVQGIGPSEAGRLLGIIPGYVSNIKGGNVQSVSLAAIDRVKLWMDSGSRLRDWKKPGDLTVKSREQKEKQSEQSKKADNTVLQPESKNDILLFERLCKYIDGKFSDHENLHKLPAPVQGDSIPVKIDLVITINGKRIEL